MKYIKYMVSAVLSVLTITYMHAQEEVGVVQPDSLKMAENVETIPMAFVHLPKKRIVGAVDVLYEEDVTTTDLNLQSAVIGRIPGVTNGKFGGNPGNDFVSLNMRGRNPMVVVDGVNNRPISALNFYEIESITFLKDATAKILYGPQASDGVVLVTTKRGNVDRSGGSIGFEYGVRSPTHTPEFLDSHTYARLYNEGRANDGLTDFYTPEQLEGFKNGNDPLEYPDVDFHDVFIKPTTNYKRIFGTYTFSDENTKYFISGGFADDLGYEAVGDQSRATRINLRSNLDYKISEVLSAQLDIALRMDLAKRTGLTNSGLYNQLAVQRPNDYPLFIGQPNDTDSLGWNPRGSNLYGQQTLTGFTEDTQRLGQINFALNYDFNSFVEGLTAKTYLTFDTYSFIAVGTNVAFETYRPTFDSEGNRTFEVVGERGFQAEQSKVGDDFYRNVGLTASIDYDRTFGDHAITSNLVLFAQNNQQQSIGSVNDIQGDRNFSLGYRINYEFSNKYIVEADVAMIGSNRLQEGNRTGVFPALGLGWILSEENFLNGSDFVNYLKLRGSFGVLGYDRNIDHFQFNDAFNFVGNISFGLINNQITNFTFRQTRLGNPNITFEKTREINIGLDAVVANNISINANYFNYYRFDMPINANIEIPDYYGGVVPTLNLGEISTTGFEVAIKYTQNEGDFKYAIGVNGSQTISTFEEIGELVAFPHLAREGTRTDAIFGFKSNGLYQTEQEIIDDNLISTLGGDVLPGDVRYEDLNGDGLIDFQDQTVIGQGAPSLYYGLTMDLRYKGFRLFAVGQGITGGERTLWNNYYRNNGEDKYSTAALGRWTPGNASNATHPRLTTNGLHSFYTSNFWVESSNFFALRNLELSYSFSSRVSQLIKSNSLTVFARGTDLGYLSERKDANPDNVNGIASTPINRTIALGFRVGF